MGPFSAIVWLVFQMLGLVKQVVKPGFRYTLHDYSYFPENMKVLSSHFTTNTLFLMLSTHEIKPQRHFSHTYIFAGT
jgi:hypothetical protein